MGLQVARAVAVDDLALEQTGCRRKADVRMWTHVDALTGWKDKRSHRVNEDQRSYGAAPA